MNTAVSFQRGGRQRGVVLVVSLLMLMVLTLIGLAATRGTALEQRMAANQNDREVAFEAAEAALRFGEGTLNAAAQPVFANNTAGAYLNTNTTYATWGNTAFWTNAANVATYGGGILPAPKSPPTYYVVQSQSATAVDNNNPKLTQTVQMQTVYYIFARGVGVSGNTVVILQSAFRE